MIRIETKLLPKPRSQDVTASLAVAVLNSSITSYADYLEREIPKIYCAKHPDSISVIKIVAAQDGELKAEKHKFCCEEFKNKVEIIPPQAKHQLTAESLG